MVNRAFLVLIFWLKKLAGANFMRFCNYVQGEQNWRCHFAVVQQTIVDKLIGLEMEDRMYCGQFGEQLTPIRLHLTMHACSVTPHEFLKHLTFSGPKASLKT